jgi:hypothetical protein
MQFYILLCFSLMAVAFLIMLLVQLLRIEKSVSEITGHAEAQVKKIYEKG